MVVGVVVTDVRNKTPVLKPVNCADSEDVEGGREYMAKHSGLSRALCI
jgi:hypothetical protein